MGEEDKPSVIRPPDTIKAKVSTGGPGAVDLDALEKAEAVIAGMADNYLEWVEEDLVKIQKASDELKAADPDARKSLIDRVFQIAHDMKGQGGSFNYDLMTILGDGLCRFVEGLETAGPSKLQVIQLYIDTMKLVITNRMSGDGGPEGEKILKGLDMVVAKTQSK